MKSPAFLLVAAVGLLLSACSSVEVAQPDVAEMHARYQQVHGGMSKAGVVALLGEPQIEDGQKSAWETRTKEGYTRLDVRFDRYNDVERISISGSYVKTTYHQTSTFPEPGTGEKLVQRDYRNALNGLTPENQEQRGNPPLDPQ